MARGFSLPQRNFNERMRDPMTLENVRAGMACRRQWKIQGHHMRAMVTRSGWL